MKKSKIILIRHGESEANLDHTIYERKFDHEIELTKKGIQQANDTGKLLSGYLPNVKDPIKALVSPYKRTQQTWNEIYKYLNRNNIDFEVDPRIIEQECTQFRDSDHRAEIFKKRDEAGRFWFRFKFGESGFDVYNRVQDFLTDLKVDRALFKEDSDYIIVSHEIALRCLLLKALHLIDISDFDNMPNIQNCAPIVLESIDFRTFSFNHDKTVGNEDLKKFLKELEQR